jgi:hypothetical protein
MRKHGPLRSSQQISYHPIALLFVRLELLKSNYVGAGLTTDVKTHTYRFGGESEQCSYLKQRQIFHFLLEIVNFDALHKIKLYD